MKPILLLSAIFILSTSFNMAGNGEIKPIKKSAVTRHAVRKETIKLYPNPSYDGTITISTTLTDTLHFYIFDLEGTLINQTILTSKEKKTVTNLNKGTYMYDVFQKDESIEEGKLIVK
jgi:hypothetical protein